MKVQRELIRDTESNIEDKKSKVREALCDHGQILSLIIGEGDTIIDKTKV